MTLYERLRFRLRMLWLGLTLKPQAGGEETPEEKVAREQEEAVAQLERDEEREKDQKPPWGDDKDFDPARAWKLIQDVRSDIDKVKGERDELREKVKTHEDASKSDQEKLGERATGAEQRATEAEKEAARLRVALDKGLTETQAKRLVGENEEELKADADELLESFRSDSDDDQESAPRRPRESLRPGAAPAAKPEGNDPAALAEKVPRSY